MPEVMPLDPQIVISVNQALFDTCVPALRALILNEEKINGILVAHSESKKSQLWRQRMGKIAAVLNGLAALSYIGLSIASRCVSDSEVKNTVDEVNTGFFWSSVATTVFYCLANISADNISIRFLKFCRAWSTEDYKTYSDFVSQIEMFKGTLKNSHPDLTAIRTEIVLLNEAIKILSTPQTGVNLAKAGLAKLKVVTEQTSSLFNKIPGYQMNFFASQESDSSSLEEYSSSDEERPLLQSLV